MSPPQLTTPTCTGALPGQFETSPAVLGALRSNALYRRPDNYWDTVADRYRGMTAQSLDANARRYINPDNFVWVVVGDGSTGVLTLGEASEISEPLSATPPPEQPVRNMPAASAAARLRRMVITGGISLLNTPRFAR